MKMLTACFRKTKLLYKYWLFFIGLSFLIADLHAQKGNNSLSVNGEVGIPVFQNDFGYGFFLKGGYGIGSNAQLTLAGGVAKFKAKKIVDQGNTITRLVPVLLGYKLNIQKFFIEPGIGIGELGGRIYINGDFANPSVAAFFGGLAAGYKTGRIDLGIRFLMAHGIDKSTAGLWYDRNFHYTSAFIGYHLLSRSGE